MEVKINLDQGFLSLMKEDLQKGWKHRITYQPCL